ncbi:hypothetical protein AK812_SmicGene20559 [Symbiodinium microadriaticum]|uniref:Uncharacterized protein n=1 Tax=Symbiodinium microadriaticum TaxID=2951 RepID=A0A1Q9DPQ3_SYMMI|nr:hypothetical protein AK812_SmicGene20559 [Symbiodinium microadriaticum]
MREPFLPTQSAVRAVRFSVLGVFGRETDDPAALRTCFDPSGQDAVVLATGFHHFLRDAEHASPVGTMQRQVAERQLQEFRELARRAQFFVVLPDMKTTLHDEKLIKKQLSVCLRALEVEAFGNSCGPGRIEDRRLKMQRKVCGASSIFNLRSRPEFLVEFEYIHSFEARNCNKKMAETGIVPQGKFGDIKIAGEREEYPAKRELVLALTREGLKSSDMGPQNVGWVRGREGLTQEMKTHAQVPKRVVDSMAEHLKNMSARLLSKYAFFARMGVEVVPVSVRKGSQTNFAPWERYRDVGCGLYKRPAGGQDVTQQLIAQERGQTWRIGGPKVRRDEANRAAAVVAPRRQAGNTLDAR